MTTASCEKKKKFMAARSRELHARTIGRLYSWYLVLYQAQCSYIGSGVAANYREDDALYSGLTALNSTVEADSLPSHSETRHVGEHTVTFDRDPWQQTERAKRKAEYISLCPLCFLRSYWTRPWTGRFNVCYLFPLCKVEKVQPTTYPIKMLHRLTAITGIKVEKPPNSHIWKLEKLF